MSKTKKVIFVVLSALVCVFALSFNFFNFNDNTLEVKADTITESYSFDGSNTLTFPSYFTSSNGYSSFLPLNFRVDFYTLAGVTYVQPDFSYYTGNGTSIEIHTGVIYSDSYSGSSITSFSLNGDSTIIYCSDNISSLRSGAFKIGVKSDIGFNSSVYKIRMYLPGAYEVLNVGFAKALHVVYYDSNDNELIFEFPVQNGFIFNDRTYYVSQDLSDNQIYNQGYQQGLLDNQTNIYDNGYKAGNTVGYNNGYNDGLNYSDQYSFFNLFGAVLDAPISTLRGLLNFELFGVNLLTLFTGLLTLAIILLVLRLIRGGK